MTADTDRPRWWYALRNFACFFVAGVLGSLAYGAMTHRPDEVPWGGVLFGAGVCAVLGVLFPGRGRR
ncbi:hypothetical protein [Streptomyces bungoensis]|uniref:hypothetical protein n=1 Tax=Streptomyces bungoensis TaxID=285568 RepID=UPI0033E52182